MCGLYKKLFKIKLLLAAEADINAQNEAGNTPLMEAAVHNKNPEVIKVLADAGAEITDVILEQIEARRKELGNDLYWEINDRRYE